MVKCFQGKHKDLSLVPKSMEERKSEWQQELVTPRAGEAETGRQIPAAASLASLLSSKPVEDPITYITQEGQWRVTSKAGLHTHTHLNLSIHTQTCV